MALLTRPVLRPDTSTLGAVLARAFFDDPIWAWVMSAEASRERRLTKMFTRFLRHGLVRGDTTATTDDLAGVAMWRAPGRWRESRLHMLRLGLQMAPVIGRDYDKMMQVGRLVESSHPREPHWYLSLLGTDPARQGKGVGSAVMRPILDVCDTEGLPAYLETETEANVAFYARHGFGIRGEADVGGGGPHMWFLWREPRGEQI